MGPSRDSNADEANPSKNQQPFTEPGPPERISNLFLAQDGVEYRIGKKIGEGSFGVLFEGERLSGGESIPVAFKFVRRLPPSYSPRLRLTRESGTTEVRLSSATG